jgi:hypothetical protein
LPSLGVRRQSVVRPLTFHILKIYSSEATCPNGTNLKTFMQRNGFTQLVNKPTTDGGTLIDHVYVHGEIQISMEVKQTYYSYHNMVVLTIKQNM